MELHGLDSREDAIAYAFFVVRFERPAERAVLRELVHHLAPLIPDTAAVLESLLSVSEPVVLYAVPWAPPEPGDAVAVQRRLVASTVTFGVEEAWFFQSRACSASSLHDLRFPVDGYPELLERLDLEDLGIAFKLAGEPVPGEDTVLHALHRLWLAPYGRRSFSEGVTIDRTHHAAHLWVERLAVSSSAEELVHRLLWIASKLDEVVPVLHARLAGASVVNKAGELGTPSTPFVLGGNPVRALYAEGGEDALDRWLEHQTEWSNEEVAQMLRELAIDLVAQARPEEEEDEAPDDDEEEDDDEDDEDDDEEEDDDAFFGDDEDDDDGVDPEDPEDEGDDDGADARAPRNAPTDDVFANDTPEHDALEDDDRRRYLMHVAGEVLAARARAGKLDGRAFCWFRRLLVAPCRYEHRRRAAAEILGAAHDTASVPALVQLVEHTPLRSAFDALRNEGRLRSAAKALGDIGDPAAIPALVSLVVAPGPHLDELRPTAAHALATCLAAAPVPQIVDDHVFEGLLTALAEHSDRGACAELYFAFGRLARALAPERRAMWCERLAKAPVPRDDRGAMLARHIALVLTGDARLEPSTAAALRPLIRDALTQLDYDHDYTLRTIRLALRIGEVLPELVDAADLVWLTRFAEPDVRERAHALLAKRGRPLAPAPAFDRYAVRTLDDPTLVRLVGEDHVVGRAALVREAGRRGLTSARGAILRVAHDVLGAVRPGAYNLLAPETSLLEAAVQVLRSEPLDADAIALFDRMLRHPNFHVKWELLQDPPDDDRLIEGMFHVLCERWGWQERVARQWLARRQGSPAYEAAWRRAGTPPLHVPDPADDPEPDEMDDEVVN
jgi:hypothetical protein